MPVRSISGLTTSGHLPSVFTVFFLKLASEPLAKFLSCLKIRYGLHSDYLIHLLQRISVVNNEQQDEKTVKAAFDCVIMSLESFDITESDVNEKVFHILNRVKIINTKEDARELIAAIWNALSRVNHIQLIEVPEKAKERMTMVLFKYVLKTTVIISSFTTWSTCSSL